MNTNFKLNTDNVFTFSDVKVTEQELKFKTGMSTDIGGGKENQDTTSCIQTADIIANGVFDGHGYDGKWIAEFCKTTTESWILENNERILLDPVKSLTELFLDLKKMLSAKIIENCHHECKLDHSNTILMKCTYTDTWQPLINGGATMTITILIKKTLKLYIANVGDTDAMLCSSKPILRQDDLKCENELKDFAEETAELIETTDYLMLTADHSPDNPKEFMRMCKIATHPSIPNKSLVNVIYDNQKVTNKKLCCRVFDTSTEIPTLLDCPVGSGYYKNVRKEYATYVASPEDRILAMTRTMGDFHMCAYGIVSDPTINSIDLSKILDRYEETDTQPTLCLLISSDGVWDNWMFNDVQNFMMYDTCLETVVSSPDGAQKVLDSFMNRNKIFGTAHFGSSADNATSSVVYINK